MRVFLATTVGLTALAATAIPAAPVPRAMHNRPADRTRRPPKMCGRASGTTTSSVPMVAFCATARARNAIQSSMTAICVTIASGRSINMSRSGRGLNGAPSLCSGSLVGEEKSKGVATGTSDQMHRGRRLALPHPVHASSRLNFRAGAPPRDECAREHRNPPASAPPASMRPPDHRHDLPAARPFG
jgi:hypothetical protein